MPMALAHWRPLTWCGRRLIKRHRDASHGGWMEGIQINIYPSTSLKLHSRKSQRQLHLSTSTRTSTTLPDSSAKSHFGKTSTSSVISTASTAHSLGHRSSSIIQHYNKSTATMCNWEQTKFEACKHTETKRMAYSCAIYTRHTYGECKFDPKKSKVFTVISYGYCKECSEMFNKYVNL